jgi:hypothetical protein
MSLLHEDMLRAETDHRLERAREARFKHGFVMLRKWRRRAAAARLGVERALALEREQATEVAPSSVSGLALFRPTGRQAGWA